MLTVSEHPSSSYGPRTYTNAHGADITIAIAVDFSTLGEKVTKKASPRYHHIHYGTDPLLAAREIYRVLKSTGSTSINLAGNGIYTFARHQVNQEQINQYVYDIFKLVHTHYPISGLRSGGQTGVDIAAGVIGLALEIPTILLFPKGFKQRHSDGIDCCHTEDDIYTQVLSWKNKLSL